MVGLTGIQQEIQDSLKEAILNSNVQAVKDIFKDNEDSNIQEVLASHSFQACASASAGFFVSYNIDVRKQIIELIWQKADQRGRDFLCVNAINMPGNLSDEVIQEMEEHKKVRVLDKNLREAIKSLDVNQVKAALEAAWMTGEGSVAVTLYHKLLLKLSLYLHLKVGLDQA